VAVPGVTVLQRRLHAELLLNSPEVWQQLLAPAVPEYSGSSARTDAATLLEMHVLEGEPLETAWDQLQQKNKRPLAVLLPLLTAVWEQTETVVRPEHRGAFRLVD
jgi:hypothetical protein